MKGMVSYTKCKERGTELRKYWIHYWTFKSQINCTSYLPKSLGFNTSDLDVNSLWVCLGPSENRIRVLLETNKRHIIASHVHIWCLSRKYYSQSWWSFSCIVSVILCIKYQLPANSNFMLTFWSLLIELSCIYIYSWECILHNFESSTILGTASLKL